jgi:hypothetical protein
MRSRHAILYRALYEVDSRTINMPRWKTSFTELTHQVVQGSPEPLTVNEIIEAVSAITSITTKNPKQTIRNAISQSGLIVSTGDGRYGWKMRLLNGSIMRHTLQEAELAEKVLYWDEDLRDALWPTFFAPQKYSDRSPVAAELPDGTITTLTLEHFTYKTWGTQASPAFWQWFETLGAKAGDHLIFRVLDGEEKRYGITFEPRAARDDAAVAAHNQAILDVACERARRSRGLAIWDLTTHLLATGMYRHPVPPDPISELWHEDDWMGSEGEALSVESRLDSTSLAGDLFGQIMQTYDFEAPLDLPREYNPDHGYRHPRQSRLARLGSVSSYVLRVSHRSLSDVWRDLELADDNTLEDLHLLIQRAYSWRDDHLYSFFLSGKSWDRSSEIGSPWSETSLHTHHIEMRQLDLHEGQAFIYLFDYGDQHEFDVTVLRINPLAPKGKYPRTLEYHGKSPPQYPDYDEQTGELGWDPHQHWHS